MTTAFSELIGRAEAEDGKLELVVPEDWMQGRSLFGGLQAALAVHTMRSLVPLQPLRSLQTNFIAPLSGAIRSEATILRAGKNTTQLEAKLFDESGLTTQCLAVFGNALVSQTKVRMQAPVVYEGSPTVFPFLPGVTPNFTQHFGMRLVHGNTPFSGVETYATAYELDLRDDGPAGELQVVALADVVPPLALSFVSQPTFGSTLSWLLEFLAEPDAVTGLAGWRVDTELMAACDGYTHQSSTLWSPKGEPMALSRQCMLVFG